MYYWKHLLCLFVIRLGLTHASFAQLSCVNCPARDTTSYTNEYANDSLYFICSGETAALHVSWSSGVLQNVQWYRFISTTNTWTPVSGQFQVSESLYNATLGGYRVVVTNTEGAVTFEDICWISRINSPPIVNANTIQPGCSAVQLTGLYFGGNVTGYYNPPPANFDEPYVFNANSEIEICLNILHPILADLSVELVTPAACGSQTIILTETQTPEDADSICYNSDAVGLCFSNGSSLVYNLCELSNFDVGGTFGAFGPDEQTIDWSVLEGCDVTQPGWALNVRDCFGGANGSLVSATMTIQDFESDLLPIVQDYLPVEGQDFNILDTGCDSSLFTIIQLERVYPQATLLSQDIGIAWESFPPFPLPNNGIGLNLLLDPGPTVDTYFSFKLANIELGEACGAISSDLELFDYIQPDSSVITLTDSILCLTDSPILLTSSIAEGQWIGPLNSTDEGVIFDPEAVGTGLWSIAFDPVSSCINPTEVFVLVDAAPQLSLSDAAVYCSLDTAILLAASPPGGMWTGAGIVDSLMGVFNPSSVNSGTVVLNYAVGGNCPAASALELTIETYTPLRIVQSDTVLCEVGAPVNFDANLDQLSWEGPGITSVAAGVFSPAAAGLGTHQLIAVYNQACSDRDTVSVLVEDASIQFTPTVPVCVNSDQVDLEVAATSGTWLGAGLVDSLQGIVDPQLLDAGVHYFVYTLANTCASVDSIALNVEDFPNVQLGLPDGLCVDQTEFVLLANYEGGAFSGDGVVSALNQSYFNPQVAGEGTAVVQYDYSDVCSVSIIDSLVVYPLPDLVVTADTAICPEGEALLSVSGASQYGWAPSSSLLTPQAATTIAQPGSSTTYAVAGESIYGCFATEEVTVTVYDAPVLTTNGPLEMCPGETEVLEVSGVAEAQWVGEAVESPMELITAVSPTLTTTYSVSGVDENGCAGAATVEVIVHQSQAFFSVSDTLGTPPMEVQFTNLSSGDYFVWVFGTGDTLITTELNAPVVSVFDGESTHAISLTAYLNGCPSSFSLSIETYYDSELLVVPNVVTPNGDGKNDTWRVETRNMDDLHVDIFTRWGMPVDQLDGINDRWDPKDFSSGTYYYKLIATGLDGESYNREGYITVLRSED
jgi:gliding motility-associated-like protein